MPTGTTLVVGVLMSTGRGGGGLGPLWLQILQNSWEGAEPTGAQRMQNPGCGGAADAHGGRAQAPSHPTQLPAPRARCLICHFSGGGSVFENKVGFSFFFLT